MWGIIIMLRAIFISLLILLTILNFSGSQIYHYRVNIYFQLNLSAKINYQKISNNVYNVSVFEEYSRQNSTLVSVASELGENITTSFTGNYYYIIECIPTNNTIIIDYHVINKSAILIPFYFPFKPSTNNLTLIIRIYNSSNQISFNYTTTANSIVSSNFVNISYTKLNIYPYYFIKSNMSYSNGILNYYYQLTSLLVNGTPAVIKIYLRYIPTPINYDDYIIAGIVALLVVISILVIRKKRRKT